MGRRPIARIDRRITGSLGTIGFDDGGDVYGYEPFTWYVWQEGDYAPTEDPGG